MIKTVFVATLMSLTTIIPALAENKTNVSLGCYSKDKIEKLINDGEFVVLLRGTDPNGKFNEIWLGPNSQSLVLSFDKPKDKDSKNIGEICVIAASSDVVYSSKTIETLYNSLNVDNPKL